MSKGEMKILRSERGAVDGAEWVSRVEFEHQGKTFVCTLTTVGVSASSAEAGPESGQWVYEVDGVQRGAGAVDPNDAPEDVAKRVLAARLQDQSPD